MNAIEMALSTQYYSCRAPSAASFALLCKPRRAGTELLHDIDLVYEAGPAITFNVGKWGSSGQFCSDRPKTSDLDVSDHLLSEAIDTQD